MKKAGRKGAVSDLASKIKSGKVKIAVYGLGHVGSPIAAVWLRFGAHVIGVDKSPSVTASLIDVSDDGHDITLMVTGGHGRGLPNPSALPGIGDTVVFGPWPEGEYFPSTLPREIPWTHRIEVVPDAELEPAS